MPKHKATQTDNGVGTMSQAGTVFASAARTASPTAVDIRTGGQKGIRLSIDVTAAGVTPSVVFSIYALDRAPATAVEELILSSAAIVGTGHTTLRVYPQLTAAANLTINDVLPTDIRIKAVHGNGVTITYSVGYELIP